MRYEISYTDNRHIWSIKRIAAAHGYKMQSDGY